GALVALADAVLEILAEHGAGASSIHCLEDGVAREAFPSRVRVLVGPRPRGWQGPSALRSIPAAGVRAACRRGRSGHAFSNVASSGCWLSRAYSLTWATLDSATSRVNT